MLAFMADVLPWGDRRDQRSNNQIDVSTPELNQRYQVNDESQRILGDAMRAIEQIGITKLSATDQRATEGTPKARRKVLSTKLQGQLSEQQWSEYKSLKSRLVKLKAAAKKLPARESVMGLARCDPSPDQTFVLFRGSPRSPADPVVPMFPAIFKQPPPQIPSASTTASTAGRRRVLADWITDPGNRLTARVMVNRIWQFHFGRGIVRSPNNFGQLGVPPTHPELLDWLAGEFSAGDWSIKAMHRLIMNSRTYQMSSATSESGLALDPNNDMFWRFDSRRLSAEEVRDSILQSAGVLNRTPYGPSFYEELSQEVLAGQSVPGKGWGSSDQRQRDRRSVYIHVKRSLLTPMLSAFDFPDPDLTCEERFTTLQPGQALALLNGDFIHHQANRLATLIQGTRLEIREVVQRTVRAVLKRNASEDEMDRGDRLIQSLIDDDGVPRQRAVELYCLSVMNWNEFLFLD